MNRMLEVPLLLPPIMVTVERRKVELRHENEPWHVTFESANSAERQVSAGQSVWQSAIDAESHTSGPQVSMHVCAVATPIPHAIRSKRNGDSFRDMVVTPWDFILICDKFLVLLLSSWRLKMLGKHTCVDNFSVPGARRFPPEDFFHFRLHLSDVLCAVEVEVVRSFAVHGP